MPGIKGTGGGPRPVTALPGADIAERPPVVGTAGPPVRVARAGDLAAVRAMHDRCSAETRRLRYFTAAPRLPEHVLSRLLLPPDGVSLVVGRPGGGVAGVATLLADGTDTGEVALLVEDEWQGHGIGTALLVRLAALAGERGMTRLRAHVLPWNRRMLHVFDRAGLPGRRTFEDGVVLVEAFLPVSRRERCA